MAKTKNPVGRPDKIIIDKEQFEKLCYIHASLNEMSSFFNCSPDTIERWCLKEYKKGYREIFQIKSGAGKMALRRKQIELAMNGDRAMLIWLGKNYLGQRDSYQLDQTVKVETINEQDKAKATRLTQEEVTKQYFELLNGAH